MAPKPVQNNDLFVSKLTNKEAKQIRDIYYSQKNFENKIYYYLFLKARNTLYQSVDMTQIERDSVNLPKDRNLPELDEELEKELQKDIAENLKADGTTEGKFRAMKAFSISNVRLIIDQAKEYLQVLNDFPENEPDREWKAKYVTSRIQTKSAHLAQALTDLKRELVLNYQEETNPDVGFLDEEDLRNLNRSDNLMEQGVDKFTEEEIEKYFSKEDIKLFKLGKAIGMNEFKLEDYAKEQGKKLGGGDPVKEKEERKKCEQRLGTWLNDMGNLIINAYTEKNRVEGFRNISMDLMKPEQYRISADKSMNFFFKDEEASRNTSLLRAVINDLESTDKGKRRWFEGKWHSDNSKLYDNMLKTMKKYEYTLSTNQGGRAHDIRNDLEKLCLQYISGKETERSHEWGKQRFDDVLMVMAEIMPEKEFEKQIAKINTIRKAKPGSKKFIDAKKYRHHAIKDEENYLEGEIYKKWSDKGKEMDEKKQQKAEESYLDIPDPLKENVASLDGLYGKTFNKKDKRLDNMFGGYAGSDKTKLFKPITDDFKAIGPAGNMENAKLSDKDFAAIAFAATTTPDVAAEDKRYVEATPADKAFFTSRKYTTDIATNRSTYSVKPYAENIQKGRMTAAEAMKAYENGSKMPLAHVLASGLKTISHNLKGMKALDQCTLADAEMGCRMLNILSRDPELFYIAEQSEGLTRNDLRNVKTMYQGANVIINEKNALKRLKEAEKGNVKFSKDEKADLLTDIVMKKIMDESIAQNRRSCEANPKYREEMLPINKRYNEEVRPIVNELAQNISGPQYFERKAQLLSKKQELDEFKDYHETCIRDKYAEQNKMLESLKDPKQVKDLRKSIKEFVTSAGLQNMSVEKLEKEMQSKNFVGKVSKIMAENQNKQKKAEEKIMRNQTGKTTPDKTMKSPGM